MRRTVLIVGLGTAVLGAAAPAFAQFQPPRLRNERPQRGLFGSGTSNTEQSLVLNVSFGGGYGQDLTDPAIGGVTPLGPRGFGQFGFGSANLSYSVARKAVQASANVGGTTQYYPEMPDPSMHSVGAGGQVSWQMAERTTLSASTQVSAQPNNLRSFYGLPVDAERQPDSTDTLDYAISGRSYMDFRNSVNLHQSLTKDLGAEVGYTFYAVDYGDQQSNYAAHSLVGRVTYQINKSLSAYGGYGRTKTDYEDDRLDGRYGGGTIDAGVTFGQALSLTRRTSLSFGTGVTGVESNDQVSYVFTGNVSLTHELGRSWTLTAGARRSADFYQTFGDPVISTSASAGVSGLLNRRIQVGAQAGWSRGTVGISGVVPEFDSWTAGASMRTAVSRNTGLSFSYSIFSYVFQENGAPLPFGTQPEMWNQSARVTFDWMLPLITIARRADASR
jgi:hypothetical protein